MRKVNTAAIAILALVWCLKGAPLAFACGNSMEDESAVFRIVDLLVRPWDLEGTTLVLHVARFLIFTVAAILTLGVLALTTTRLFSANRPRSILGLAGLILASLYVAYLATGSTLLTTMLHHSALGLRHRSFDWRLGDAATIGAFVMGLHLLALLAALIWTRSFSPLTLWRRLPKPPQAFLQYPRYCFIHGTVWFWVLCIPIHILIFYFLPDIRR